MAAPINPSDIGAQAEAAVASALVRTGRAVFVPVFSAGVRIDLMYLDGEEHRVVRVQCKTARRVGDVLFFRTCSNTANLPRDYIGQVDEFGVYSPDTGRVYLVPVSGLPRRSCYLRLTPTLNGQAAGVRWAHDFELGRP